jgi:NitT/TauT family transport system substrate-binding protein
MKFIRLLSLASIVSAALVTSSGPSFAEEAKTIRFSKQFGISYLPLVILEQKKLVEKHTAAAGIEGTKAEYVQLTGGTPINDALISGQIDIGAGGVGPLITIWAKTRDNLKVQGISAINSMPLYLNTVNPNVKTIKDFTEKDKIALPSVKVSIQAVTLQMAAEQAFGEGNQNKLDQLTVSMSHPDGMASMLSGNEITAHFTSAPFMYQQLKDPRVRKVLSSYDVLGGPGTFNVLWCKAEFREKNPKTYAAIIAALKEAMDFIKANPDETVDIWIKAENSKLDPAFVRQIITDPENVFTVAPQKVMVYANFMSKIGSIKTKPADWKELFFPEIHDQQGS